MPRLLVGLPQLVGKLATYADRYDCVEIKPVDTALPKASKLAQWREQVPPSFAFSVILPKAVAAFEPGSLDALESALEAARVLQASTLVLVSPPSIRPTKKNRERIGELASRLPRDAHTLAWQASGMWEIEDVMATAALHQLNPIVDASMSPLPPGPMVYTRIRALGHAAQLGADRIDQIAHQLAGRREATVIVEGDQARKLRTELRAALDRMTGQTTVPHVFMPRELRGTGEEQ
jgi:uncharacterized protein YecE (DUF72 family)